MNPNPYGHDIQKSPHDIPSLGTASPPAEGLIVRCIKSLWAHLRAVLFWYLDPSPPFPFSSVHFIAGKQPWLEKTKLSQVGTLMHMDQPMPFKLFGVYTKLHAHINQSSKHIQRQEDLAQFKDTSTLQEKSTSSFSPRLKSYMVYHINNVPFKHGKSPITNNCNLD